MLFAIITVGVVYAEDGVLLRRNISKTPDVETEKVAFYIMDFYVLAQDSTDLIGAIENYELADDAVYLNLSKFLSSRAELGIPHINSSPASHQEHHTSTKVQIKKILSIKI
jgi:hypothetical protein